MLIKHIILAGEDKLYAYKTHIYQKEQMLKKYIYIYYIRLYI